MDTLMFCIFCGLGLLIVCFVIYSTLTNGIIREYEKQNAALRTENKRLHTALRRKNGGNA